MTIESCLIRSANERFRYFCQSYIEYCEGNKCAAGLIDFFAQYHSRKLEKKQLIDGKVYQHHTIKELSVYLLGLFSKNTVRNALHYLEKKGIISIHANLRDKWKKSKCYIFHPEKYNDWIKKRILENDPSFAPEELPEKKSMRKSEVSTKANELASINQDFKEIPPRALSNQSSPELNNIQLPSDLDLGISLSETDEIDVCINFDAQYVHQNLTYTLDKNDCCDELNLDNRCIKFNPPIAQNKSFEGLNLVHRETEFNPSIVRNQPFDGLNLDSRRAKFGSSIYNKINNKKKQEPTTTVTTTRDFSKIADEKKSSVIGCIIFDNQKNIFSEAVSTNKILAPVTVAQTSAPNATTSPVAEKIPLSQFSTCEKNIENRLTAAQKACIQHLTEDWLTRGKICNPTQIFAEIEFALLNKETLSRSHYSFPKKLNIISEFIETGRWTTPVPLRKQSKSALDSSTPPDKNNVVTMQNPQAQQLRDIDSKIRVTDAELLGCKNQLGLFRDTPSYRDSKNFIEKNISDLEHALKVLMTERNRLAKGLQPMQEDPTPS